MKKLIGFLLVLLVLVILVAGIGTYVLYSKKDSIVRSATERALNFALMTKCTVGGAHVDVGKGLIEFTDIEIGNPPGYETSHAMKFATVSVEADVASFKSDEPTIRNIHIGGTDIVLERNLKSSNLQDLMANAGRFSSGKEEKPKEEEGGKSLKIDRILVDETVVQVALPMSGGKTMSVKLPKTEMKDIGGKKDKVTPAEALQEFLARLLASITDVGANILPKDLLNDIGGSLKTLPGDLQKTLTDTFGDLDKLTSGAGEAASKAGKDLQNAADSAVKSVEDSVGDLFGTKKKKEEQK